MIANMEQKIQMRTQQTKRVFELVCFTNYSFHISPNYLDYFLFLAAHFILFSSTSTLEICIHISNHILAPHIQIKNNNHQHCLKQQHYNQIYEFNHFHLLLSLPSFLSSFLSLRTTTTKIDLLAFFFIHINHLLNTPTRYANFRHHHQHSNIIHSFIRSFFIFLSNRNNKSIFTYFEHLHLQYHITVPSVLLSLSLTYTININKSFKLQK